MAIENEMANFAELTVTKKLQGTYLVKRVLMILAYILVPLLILIGLLAVGAGAVGLIVYIPVMYTFFLPRIIIPATYRYVQIEYEYEIAAGDMSAAYIYGRRSRKEIVGPITVSSMETIAPYRDTYKAAADDPSIQKRYEAVAYMGHPDNYYAIFRDDEGKKCVLFFQATNKVLKLLRFLNRSTVVTEVSM